MKRTEDDEGVKNSAGDSERMAVPLSQSGKENIIKFSLRHAEVGVPKETSTWRSLLTSWVQRTKASGKKVESGQKHGGAGGSRWHSQEKEHQLKRIKHLGMDPVWFQLLKYNKNVFNWKRKIRVQNGIYHVIHIYVWWKILCLYIRLIFSQNVPNSVNSQET